MTDSIKVQGPVQIEPDSVARVAFELMKHIASYEKNTEVEREGREYWLRLYHQCRLAARVSSLDRVLEVSRK